MTKTGVAAAAVARALSGAGSLSSINLSFGAISSSLNNLLGINDLPEIKIRTEGGTAKIGSITYTDFLGKSLSEQIAFFQSDLFSPDPNVRSRVKNAIDRNFVDQATRANIIKKSEAGAADLQKRVSNPDGTINTSLPSWQTVIKSLTTITLLGVVLHGRYRC